MSPQQAPGTAGQTRSSAALDGQVGIVTGGGKGLGRAFALDLAAAGARLVVNNRNREVDSRGLGPADHVVAEIRAAGGEALAEHSDVADPRSAGRILDLTLRTYGRVDFLVTSAGISAPAMFHKVTPEQFDAVVAVNLAGSAHLAAACSRVMREQGAGRIVLVSSTAGLHGEPTASAYTASKGALVALGRAIAVEGARRGVRTNVLLPYATTQMTDTGMADDYRDEMTAQAVAPVVTALVDPGCTLNGQILVSGGGALRAASTVEFGTVLLPGGPLSADALADLVARSRTATPKEYPDAQEAFLDLATTARAARAGASE